MTRIYGPERYAELLPALLAGADEEADRIVPVALVRRAVEAMYNGEGAKLVAPKEWADEAGNVIVVEYGMADRDGFSDRGKKERPYYRLNLSRMLVGRRTEPFLCLTMAVACLLIDDINIGNCATERAPSRWWVWESNGGNCTLILHELVGGGEGRFRCWVNPED